MTEFESRVFEKLDGIHSRINDVHERIDDIGKLQAAHEVHINNLVGNGQPGKIAKIEERLTAQETLASERRGMSRLGKLAWAAIVGILGSDFLAHASELVKKLATITTR